MKYLKFFEAFASSKISKTLAYIDSQSRNVFKSKLKSLLKTIDFPMSEISDEYIEYLPYKAALKKADIITDTPCDATSEEAFPNYTVEGEVCQGGKIKRTWGDQIRTVTCPICSGTGIKPNPSNLPIKLVKFWFTASGEFLNVITGVDGIVSNNLYSDELPNYFSWNFLLRINDWGINKEKYSSVEEYTRKAHFALVIDLEKLSKSNYTKKADIQQKRREVKSGAFDKDSDIKKQNIERYLNKIKDNSDITKDITKVDSLIKRAIRYDNALFYIVQGNILTEIESVADNYYNLMKTGDNYYVDNIENKKNYILDRLKEISPVAKVDKLKVYLRTESDLEEDLKLPYIEILDKLLSISTSIYGKISTEKYKTIEDLEIFSEKMRQIHSFFRKSRYGIHDLVYFISEIIRNDSTFRLYVDLTKGWNRIKPSEISNVLENLNKFESIVNRILK